MDKISGEMSKRPLAIDLFCGLGGWTEGLLATGWRVIGFDIEQHVYGDKRYPAEMVVQDVLTLHGSQFKNADLIVASPPCQKYSYMAMPWSKAKALAEYYRGSAERLADLNALFDACFRIQREASEAAGRHIPMVVENVRGAQRWVGRAKGHYGSYYLWGDVPSLMPMPTSLKNTGGSWFGERDGKPIDRNDPREGYKSAGLNWSDRSKRGQDFTRIAGRQAGIKQGGLPGTARCDRGAASVSSRSNARKQASAEIAKIPFALARHIGEVYGDQWRRQWPGSLVGGNGTVEEKET
jgi:hypothetical protein